MGEVVLKGRDFGPGQLFIIAGPCVIESRELCLRVGEFLAELGERLGVGIIFKSSFDKANRTSLRSFRGPGLEEGLKILEDVAAATGLPVTTDIHLPEQAEAVGQVVDVVQVPALLCRQSDLLIAAGRTGRVVNVKKGQFMAPEDMVHVAEKIRSTGNDNIWLTERGTSFGYHNLVVDMRSIPIMAATGCTVVFDATHSVQRPAAMGTCSGGDRTMAPVLARAAVAAGAHGVFMEVHPEPEQALCDGPNSLALRDVEGLVRELMAIREAIGG